MTSADIVTRHAPTSVVAFLKGATPPQRAWYLTRGEPQCLLGTYLVEGDLVERLFPALRGIRVGEHVATPEEAVAAAGAVRLRLLVEPLEPVDEAELGIDDEAIRIADMMERSGARIETILHIGSMMDDDGRGPVFEAVAGIVMGIRSARRAVRPPAPLLEGVDPRSAPVAERLPEVVEDLPLLRRLADMEGRPSRAEIAEELMMLTHDLGALGFLVEVSVPQHVPHADGAGASIHGGVRTTGWRYASTFAVAAARAAQWADDRIDEMWPARAKAA
jgi:hypothetical protein